MANAAGLVLSTRTNLVVLYFLLLIYVFPFRLKTVYLDLPNALKKGFHCSKSLFHLGEMHPSRKRETIVP